MLEIDRLKEYLVDKKIINLNVIYPKIDLLAADIANDAATFKTVATPAAIPAAGAVLIGNTVSLICNTPDSHIHYTTGATTPADPTTASAQYSSAITIPYGGLIIKGKGYKGYQTASNVLSATYTIIKAATPVADPVAGNYAVNTPIELTCSTPNSTIYYTVNGDVPTNASTVYNAAITLTEAFTLKAKAYSPLYDNSAILSAAYTVDA